MKQEDIFNKVKEFLQNTERPLVAVIGPTASGKTKFSLDLAQAINGEIISTDSRQIYREMDLATDAIPQSEQRGVPHHMLGIADPDELITLTDFTDRTLKIIDEIYDRGNVPILAGGTGLYVSALIDDYEVPRVPPNEQLRAKLESESPEQLHAKLQKLDPEAAAKIHPNNKRYVIRAIEVAMSEPAQAPRSTDNKFDSFLIGITRPREEIYKRIEKRVDEQLDSGLIDEVKALVDKGYDENLPSMSSLGVKEIIPYIKGEMSLEECSEILKRNTRRYAKRQCTWLKRYENVTWINPSEL